MTAPAGPPESGSVPMQTCFRHPDRATLIRCARCGRPICPDCMVDAPVGFQCPECVAQGRAAVPAVRNRFGGRVRREAPVVPALIVVCVVLFAAEVLTRGGLLSGAAGSTLVQDFGLRPLAVAAGEWWRLATAMFLHAGLLHLALNMYALWILGGELERSVGALRFLTLFLVAGVAGAVASYWTLPVAGLSVGASGAIFGIVGGMLVGARRLGYDVRQVLMLAVVLFLPGLVIANVDVAAHLGGLLGGAAVMAGFAFAPRGRVQPVVQALVVVGVVVILAALVATRTAAIVG